MKKIYLTFLSILTAGALLNATAQQQPNNSGFENWESIGNNNFEPTNWSGMMTGSLCGLCGFGSSQRIFQDNTIYRSGSASARIESTSAIGGVTVNGAMTTGEVNAPSTTPSQGYNETLTGNANFNHPFTEMPDSVVFYAQYNVTTSADSARISFVLHDNYNGFRDPADANSASHVVGTARKNFQTGGTGTWKRISIPFDYSGPSTSGIAYLLATFTSSYIPGSGSTSAKLWIDDLEFIYNQTNPTSVEELADAVAVYPNPTNDGRVNISLGSEFKNGSATVFNTVGQTVGVFNFSNSNLVQFTIEQPSGMYFVNIQTEDGQFATVRVVKG
jgi:hypothetical protein